MGNNSTPRLSPMVIIIFLVILILSVVGVFVYLLWPHSPEVQITSISITPPPPLNYYNSKTAVWNIVFDFKNPNRWSIDYENVTVWVYSQHMLLSPPPSVANNHPSCFRQSKNSHKNYETSVLVKNDAGEKIMNSRVDILLRGKYTYKPELSSWKKHHHSMTVSCDNVEIGFDEFGCQGGRKRCIVI